jgi:beta-lactamase class A
MTTWGMRGTVATDVRLRELLAASDLAGTDWSIDIRDVWAGTSLATWNSHRLLQTASAAKVYLLIELAVRFVAGSLDPHTPVDRRSVSPVSDSGLWQHLAVDVLPAVDVAWLVASVSDNLGTNVLLDLIGLQDVQERASLHAPDGSTLHDLVRDIRGESDPATFSEGSAADWASLFAGLARGTVESPEVSALVVDWLAAGSDLSMVAAAFGLDPLAHGTTNQQGLRLTNKTGTDAGVRADVGVVSRGGDCTAYAVLCNWVPDRVHDPRDAVLRTMRVIGRVWCR